VVVHFIIPHGERKQPGGTNVAEVFKIVDGKVRSIEEFSFTGAFPPSSGFADEPSPVPPLAAAGAKLTPIASNFKFTEGPAADHGLYKFRRGSTTAARRIISWSVRLRLVLYGVTMVVNDIHSTETAAAPRWLC